MKTETTLKLEKIIEKVKNINEEIKEVCIDDEGFRINVICRDIKTNNCIIYETIDNFEEHINLISFFKGCPSYINKTKLINSIAIADFEYIKEGNDFYSLILNRYAVYIKVERG